MFLTNPEQIDLFEDNNEYTRSQAFSMIAETVGYYDNCKNLQQLSKEELINSIIIVKDRTKITFSENCSVHFVQIQHTAPTSFLLCIKYNIDGAVNKSLMILKMQPILFIIIINY